MEQPLPQSDDLLSDAKSLFQQGKFAEADRAVRQYLESHANSAEGHFLLGHILFRETQAQATLEIQDSSSGANARLFLSVIVGAKAPTPTTIYEIAR